MLPDFVMVNYGSPNGSTYPGNYPAPCRLRTTMPECEIGAVRWPGAMSPTPFIVASTKLAYRFTLILSESFTLTRLSCQQVAGRLLQPSMVLSISFRQIYLLRRCIFTYRARGQRSSPSTTPLLGVNRFYKQTTYVMSGKAAQPLTGKAYTVTIHYADANRTSAIESTLQIYIT